MARIGDSGLGLKPRVLYQDAAQLEALRTEMNKTAHSRQPQVKFARGLFRSALRRGGLEDPMVPAPSLLPGRTSRLAGREMQALMRGIVRRHGRLTEVGKQDPSAEGRMLSTLQGLLHARDQLELRLAQLTKM